ncbi:hypothetical protein ABTK37_19885, partial [Acinetobacter baumannii]
GITAGACAHHAIAVRLKRIRAFGQSALTSVSCIVRQNDGSPECSSVPDPYRSGARMPLRKTIHAH